MKFYLNLKIKFKIKISTMTILKAICKKFMNWIIKKFF